ncbi:hypothetical protein ACFL4T_02110 [candidate division KSB1 bacterium]
MKDLKTIFALSVLNIKLLFTNKFFYFILGIILYFGFVCTINYFSDPGDSMPGYAIYIALIFIPMSVLTVFLSAYMLPGEMENNTLESLFSISGSIYKVWIIKISVMYIAISIMILILEILSYFMIADFPFFYTFFMSLFPLYFIGGLTFYFAVKFKSYAAAGILTGIIMILISFVTEPLQFSKFFLYINPIAKPRDINNYVWTRTLVENRVGMLVFGSLLYYLGLNKLKFREKFMR